jgi:hypothetical protein
MIRLELPETVTRDQLDDASLEAGLRLLDIVPASPTHPAQHIYLGPDRQSLLHLLEDGRSGALSFVLQGPAEEALAQMLRARFPPIPEEAP